MPPNPTTPNPVEIGSSSGPDVRQGWHRCWASVSWAACHSRPQMQQRCNSLLSCSGRGPGVGLSQPRRRGGGGATGLFACVARACAGQGVCGSGSVPRKAGQRLEPPWCQQWRQASNSAPHQLISRRHCRQPRLGPILRSSNYWIMWGLQGSATPGKDGVFLPQPAGCPWALVGDAAGTGEACDAYRQCRPVTGRRHLLSSSTGLRNPGPNRENASNSAGRMIILISYFYTFTSYYLLL